MTRPMSDEEMRALLDHATGPIQGDIDPNDLAQFANAELDADTEQALNARLSQANRDERGLALAVAVEGAAASAQSEIGRPTLGRRSAWQAMAAAAIVLCVVGLGWLLMRPSTPTVPAADGEALVATFARVRAQAPEAFAGVAPMLQAELAVPHTSLLRGGLVIQAPAGAYRGVPPTATWEAVPGAGPYTVRVLDDQGREVVRTEVTATDFPWPTTPAFEPGRIFTLIVTTHVAGMRQRGSAVFHRLTEPELATLRRAERALATIRPPSLRSLMRSQLALRRGLFEEARTYAKAGDEEGAWGPWIVAMRKHLGVSSTGGASTEK